MNPIEYDFIRYLAAKKSIDDSALNRKVRDEFSKRLPKKNHRLSLRVLELGAGIGTMVERLVDWGLLTRADYTAVDAEPDYIRAARNRLNRWVLHSEFAINWHTPATAKIQAAAGQLSVTYVNADVYHFFEQAIDKKQWDIGLAHAFMDLVDIAEVVPRFCKLIKPGGLLYLTLNYDGETILLPTVDRKFDQRIIQLYHQSMDDRSIDGKKAGDSKTGRHLFIHLINANAEILAAGSSDWVVFPGPGGYTTDETYFLHFIVHTIFTELKGHASLNQRRLNSWARQRHTQIEREELIFIARQMDLLARIAG